MTAGFARRGPIPDPLAQRRDRKDDQATWTTLPVAGRQGPAPPWPLPGRPSSIERRQWVREWARPQAVQWEANGQLEEVAVYVQTLMRAGMLGASPPLLNTLIKQQDFLGISLVGLARHRWKIEEPPVARKRTNDPDRAAQKAALRAIVGGAA